MKKQRFTRAIYAIGLVLALLAMVWAITACKAEEPEERSYNTLVYTEQGGAKLVVESGGEIEVQSGGVLDIQSGATTGLEGDVTFTLGAAQQVQVDGATTAQTQTDGALDVNAASVTADTAALDVLMTANDGTSSAVDVYGARLAITNNDADADMFGLQILASATTNAAAGSYEYGLAFDCTENTATACTDGVLITSDGVNLGLTDGVDVSAANILNAVNIGVNPILGSNGDSFTVGVTDDEFKVTREDAGSVTYSCADDNTVADCIYDSGTAGAVTLGSGDTTNVTVNSDVGLTFAGGSDSINNLVDDFFDFTRDDTGIVTLLCSDDDATAGCTYDAGGASPIVIGSADVTAVSINSDTGLTFVDNGDSINNLVDDFFDFGRDDTGIVTLVCSDDDGVAGCTYDAGGASPIVIGSADVTNITVNSDVGLTFNGGGDSINNLVDDAFDFTRDDTGVVTFTCSDDDGVAGCIYDAGGASPIVVGSGDVTAITLTTAGNILTMADAPGVGTGGDFLNLAGTFAAADGADTMVGLNIDITGADHAGASNSTIGIDLGLTTPDAQTPSKGLLITDTDWDYAIDVGPLPVFSSAQVWAEDFLGVVMPTETVLLNGSDGQALDPAIAQGQYGIVEMVAGDSQANAAADGSVLALGLHWSADQGSLVFETRVHVDDITDVTMCVGMSDDIATVQIPFTLTGDTDTGVADDFIGFCFDTGATTDNWWFVGVNNTAEATGNAATDTAPANGVFQVLRVEVDANGEDARGYIDGVLKGTITANSVAEAVLLSPHISVQSHAAATRTLTLDYVYVGAQRQ